MTTRAVHPTDSESRPPANSITLGVYTFEHLGDCLCVTPLPRLLRLHHGAAVYLPDIPSSRAVFTNNPYVSGFAEHGEPNRDQGLVIWTTEFGRHPFAQGAGRDHNGGTFVSWLAGAGIKGGAAYGESDQWSWKAAVNATDIHDLHATVLHLMGINHEKLTFRHNGSDRRLTDVHGHVVREILA